MRVMTKSNTDIHITESNEALLHCNEYVDSLNETCCISSRSPNMAELKSLIDETILFINKINSDGKKIENVIDQVGKIGTKVGYLYATCCTKSRETLYRSLFLELAIVHSNMWSLKGHN